MAKTQETRTLNQKLLEVLDCAENFVIIRNGLIDLSIAPKGSGDPCVGSGCLNIGRARLRESMRTVAFNGSRLAAMLSEGGNRAINDQSFEAPPSAIALQRQAIVYVSVRTSFTSTRLSSAMHCEATAAAAQRVSKRQLSAWVRSS
jgi:hypothetical protein